MFRASLLLLIGLSFCQGDETVSGYSANDVTWELEDLHGDNFQGDATIVFPEEGKVTGKAPCNNYFATQTAPYPWFTLEDIGVTRMMCDDMDLEATFFTALNEMTIVEVVGDTLILTNDKGGEMVFRAD